MPEKKDIAQSLKSAPVILLSVLIFFSLAWPAAALDSWREPLTGMEFIQIPAGSFTRGQAEAEKKELLLDLGNARYEKYCLCEKPRRQIQVAGFWLGRCEVSNAQFRLFQSEHDSGVFQGLTLNENRQPVVEVSWHQAIAFARWLSERCGRDFRLPTEAEWEHACRAGTETIRFWGDNPHEGCEFANVADQDAFKQWPSWDVTACSDGFKVASPVGSFKANPFGLCDMLGNVWEWCSDWYASDYYANSSEVDPRGPENGRFRIVRGAAWHSSSRYVRAAGRKYNSPDSRNYAVGFRLAISCSSP